MKKLLFSLFAVVATALVFSACSSSSDSTPNLSSVIAGTYDVTVTDVDDESDSFSSSLVVTRLSDNTVSLTVGGITFSPVMLTGTTTTVNLAGTAGQDIDGGTYRTLTGTITAEGIVNLSVTKVEPSSDGSGETYRYTISGSRASGDGPEPMTLADVAAGTYDVSLMVYLVQNGETTPEGPIEATVVITKATDTSVNFELRGFEIAEGLEIPVTMEGLSISGTSAAIEIAETTKTVTITELEAMGVDPEVDVTVAGQIENQSALILDISLPIAMEIMPGMSVEMTVNVVAEGTKQ